MSATSLSCNTPGQDHEHYSVERGHQHYQVQWKTGLSSVCVTNDSLERQLNDTEDSYTTELATLQVQKHETGKQSCVQSL